MADTKNGYGVVGFPNNGKLAWSPERPGPMEAEVLIARDGHAWLRP